MLRYEQFPHTADIGIRVFGKDLKELFANAAFGMFDVIADLEGIRTSAEEVVEAAGETPEELLVAWLDELLYRFCTKDIIYSKFEIEEISDNRIKAKVFGRPAAANRNRLKVEIKAVTYGGLEIKKTTAGYQVEIIFDV
ncbi:MAG: archease [Candidatus Omnitrophica bacterium]|nr:archease [Candidatus Omnitrophota bacterium]MDD5436248.1 archease [Candidatus Omnitrophota bacterium]